MKIATIAIIVTVATTGCATSAPPIAFGVADLCSQIHAERAVLSAKQEALLDSCLAGRRCPTISELQAYISLTSQATICVNEGYFPRNLKAILAQGKRLQAKYKRVGQRFSPKI